MITIIHIYIYNLYNSLTWNAGSLRFPILKHRVHLKRDLVRFFSRVTAEGSSNRPGVEHNSPTSNVEEVKQEVKPTLPETNIAPENGPSQKETSIPNINFQLRTVSFREGKLRNMQELLQAQWILEFHSNRTSRIRIIIFFAINQFPLYSIYFYLSPFQTLLPIHPKKGKSLPPVVETVIFCLIHPGFIPSNA